MSKGTHRNARKGKNAQRTQGESPAFVPVPNVPRGEGESIDAYNARATSIVALWDKLRENHTRNEGKGYRRRLRALGHFGGMRHERAQGRANVVATNVVANASPKLGTTRDAC
jgi:hypothetical protein